MGHLSFLSYQTSSLLLSPSIRTMEDHKNPFLSFLSLPSCRDIKRRYRNGGIHILLSIHVVSCSSRGKVHYRNVKEKERKERQNIMSCTSQPPRMRDRWCV